MELFHFTGRGFLRGILAEGLKLGSIPVMMKNKDSVHLLTGYQWLTKNGDFLQHWESKSTLPYRRNDYRLSIEIPPYAYTQLMRWQVYAEKQSWLHNTAEVLNSFGDPENWFVFKGIVLPEWIKSVTANKGVELYEFTNGIKEVEYEDITNYSGE